MTRNMEGKGHEYKPQTKSIVLTGSGGYGKLKIEQRPRPTPGKDEVLVNVKAAGITFAELMALQGVFCDPKMKCPIVLGMEGSGVVVQRGEEVSSVKVIALLLCISHYNNIMINMIAFHISIWMCLCAMLGHFTGVNII